MQKLPFNGVLFYAVYFNKTPKNSVFLSKKRCDISISISGQGTECLCAILKFYF